MLTENRKRQHGDVETGHLVPQAKRQSRGYPLSPEPGRDAWDSESSNSETSSSISSPEHVAGSCSSQCVAGPCSPLSLSETSDLGGPSNLVSYQHINRILKEAHFQSLQCRGQLRDTHQSFHLWSMPQSHVLNGLTLPDQLHWSCEWSFDLVRYVEGGVGQ